MQHWCSFKHKSDAKKVNLNTKPEYQRRVEDSSLPDLVVSHNDLFKENDFIGLMTEFIKLQDKSYDLDNPPQNILHWSFVLKRCFFCRI